MRPGRLMGQNESARRAAEHIIWEDPPEPEKQRIKGLRDPYSTILLKMRERPGDWVRLSSYHKQGAAITQIERWSKHKQLKDYEWVATKVRQRYWLYVRYTGKMQAFEEAPYQYIKAVRKAVAS